MSAQAKTKTNGQGGDAVPVIHGDGWTNLLSKQGTRGDKTQHSRPSLKRGKLPWSWLEAMYATDGMARKIVDLPAEEMTREWYRVEGDPQGAVMANLQQELNVKEVLTDAERWSRLYGGALVVVGANDGGDLEDPLNEASVRELLFLRVYDRNQVTREPIEEINVTDLAGLDSRDPLEPEWYRVTPYGTGHSFRVHRSRVWRFQGAKLPERERQRNDGWGLSELEGCYEALRDWNTVHNATANVVVDFIQSVLSVKGLSDMIAGGEEEVVSKRLDILDLSRSVLNTMLIDADGEQYTKHASSVAGLADLTDRHTQRLAAITNMPVTKLAGISPGGMNATGESDIRQWYDELKGQQEDKHVPFLQWLVDLSAGATRGPLAGTSPGELRVKANALWQRTDEEEAELRKKVAETDEIYLRNAVVDASEIALSRFGGDEWSMDTKLIVKGLEGTSDDPEAQAREREAMEEHVASGGGDREGEEHADPERSLNGAQVTSLLEVVSRVAHNELPRETGVAIITAAFPISSDLAERIMGTVGQGFTPAAPEPSAPPAVPPEVDPAGDDE